MNRRKFIGAAPAALLIAQGASAALAQTHAVRKKGVMYMNRISPKTSDLYICNVDGGGERKFLQNGVFDYHASYTPDGKWVLFTTERNGLGNSDVYRARPDGTGIEPVAVGPHIEDASAMSPDGTKVAFCSTRDGWFANIWVMDLKTKKARNLTAAASAQADRSLPDGYFRPSWSPDSQWLAFSSDRNTDWRGHDNGAGWEHTQELSVYVIRADGTGFRRVASKPGWCLGSPKWSPDGKRVAFYEITTEHTWGARRPEGLNEAESQIVSVDVASGGDRVVHTSGPGLKVFPQYVSAAEIAYHRKGGKDEGLYFTSGRKGFQRSFRSPTVSPDGKTVIYEKVAFRPDWTPGRPLASWDPQWDYRFIDVLPVQARDGTLAYSEQQNAGSITIMKPDGSDRRIVFDTRKMVGTITQLQGAKATVNADGTPLSAAGAQAQGAGGFGGVGSAYGPGWSPDSQWVTFGVGQWFQQRTNGRAVICRVRRDGTGFEVLTDGSEDCGFPSYSADGKKIVYRVAGKNWGLRVLDLDTRKIATLSTEWDNNPQWSPDGSKILFTRKVDAVNYDVYTMRPDGSDLMRLTTNRSNDGHAFWTADGKQITWDSGLYGFKDEVTLYDDTFQPYGQIWIMNADGTDKRVLTDSLWEDTFGVYVPNNLMKSKA